MGMERNRDRETEMHGEIREIDRERPKGERKEVGRVVEEGGGRRGEEKALVMLCDLGQVRSALCV